MTKRHMSHQMEQKLIDIAKHIDSGCGEPKVYYTPVKVRMRGPIALFSRPELRVDKISYPVPTFSALRNILQKAYWHHGVQFIPVECIVVNPIRYDSITTKGVKSIKKARMGEDHVLAGSRSEAALCTTKYLWNVDYIVIAYIVSRPNEMNPDDTLEKFYSKTMKNIEKGCAKDPYFGTRECRAEIELVTDEEIAAARIEAKKNNGSQDLGIVTMDSDYTERNGNPAKPAKPFYLHATMKDGVVNFMEGEVFN